VGRMQFSYVKAGGVYSNHWALVDYKDMLSLFISLVMT
jgi:hypothetical protein